MVLLFVHDSGCRKTRIGSTTRRVVCALRRLGILEVVVSIVRALPLRGVLTGVLAVPVLRYQQTTSDNEDGVGSTNNEVASALPNRNVPVMPTLEESRLLSVNPTRGKCAPISGGEVKQEVSAAYENENVSQSRTVFL